MGKLVKLRIEGFGKPDFPNNKKNGSIDLQINPESITHTHKINYTRPQNTAGGGAGTGAPGTSDKFDRFEPETISFDFYFDSTGVFENTPDVMTSIKNFKNLTYKFSGADHGPSYLKLIWGADGIFGKQKRTFRCRMTSLNISYNLFKPDGTPLRAKLSATFSQFLKLAEANKEANKNSPDLTHVRTIRKGDRLAMICEDIYGDPSYYLQVARINGLTNLSNLTPGSQISFPPISKS